MTSCSMAYRSWLARLSVAGSMCMLVVALGARVGSAEDLKPVAAFAGTRAAPPLTCRQGASTRPARAPVRRPPSTASWPLTSTQSIPLG